ncbi:hypothetical protein PR202_ga22508 [Eleusine coracana subsp. coracana]|uniref:Uncharacterized protein n=1 Tax=Eleusine coracana subsp. coracana TaxID=191504 RepID=A0AAV5D3V0_ELECO|nr:hypothetical protein PR202_ga22508 [Eleusine coracana subsp. coracana]
MAAVAEISASTISMEEVVGSHVLRIEQYSTTKNLPWGNFFRSSTFAAAGHRWSIKYSPSFKEYDNADWIWVHLQLEQTFAQEVKAQFTTTLLDAQGNLVTAYVPRTTAMFTFVKGSSNGHTVIRRKDLEKSGYVVNDSFRIRFDITVFKEANRFESGSARKPFVVVPPSDMARHIADLHSGKEGTDIDLEVDGQTFPAHRSILAARSPIFHAQLLGPMKKDDAVCMWIEDIEARVFKAFLYFVYHDTLPEIDEGEAMVITQHLLEAADRYGMERLKLVCEDKLCDYVDASSVGTILALAEQHEYIPVGSRFSQIYIRCLQLQKSVDSSMSSSVGGSASTISSKEVSGWHVLTIEQYTRSKNLRYGTCFRSSTFAAAGNLWSIKYYPNGFDYNSTDWIYFYLHLEQTPQVIKAQFTTSLLDLKGNPMPTHKHRSSCILTICKDTPITSLSIKKKELEQSGCLSNDSFKIRCDITVLKETNKVYPAATAVKSFVVVPPSNIDQHLGHLLTSKEGVDITLEVDGEAFPAHRSILAARSPVFKAQLFGPVTGQNTAVCMWIEDIEAGVFKAFLHFVYNDSLPEVEEGETMIMAQRLLVAADRYGMDRLKLICEDKLCNYIDMSSVGAILVLAEQHCCGGLKQACLKFLLSGSNLKEAIATDGFHHLSKNCPSVLMELLEKLAL